MRKLIVVAAALVAISCSKDIQNSDAVKQGVMDYLRANKDKTGLNIDAMQVEVRQVSFQRDEAHAGVTVTPKGIPGGGMQLTYVLTRSGNKWVVKGRTENGANPHGGDMQQLSPGSPQGVPQGLPPNHPAVPGAGQPQGLPGGQLPPGHPSVGTKSTGTKPSGTNQ